VRKLLKLQQTLLLNETLAILDAAEPEVEILLAE
jgi:hypothetical protein